MQLFKKINLFIFDRRKNKVAKNREKAFVNLKQIKSAILVCSIDRDVDLQKIIQVRDFLIKELDRVKICCYVRDNKTSLKTDSDTIIITKRDITTTGRPQEAIDILEKESFDMLLDVSMHASIPLYYILINTNSKLLCGTDKSKFKYFDFLLDTTKCENVKEMFIAENIIHYLRNINSSN